MFIRVSSGLGVTLDSAEDLKSFKVVAELPESRVEDVTAALDGIAVVDAAGYAWVFEHWLRSASEHRDDAAWQDGVGKMIAYAKRFGWVDETAGTIRAHIEWSDSKLTRAP